MPILILILTLNLSCNHWSGGNGRTGCEVLCLLEASLCWSQALAVTRLTTDRDMARSQLGKSRLHHGMLLHTVAFWTDTYLYANTRDGHSKYFCNVHINVSQFHRHFLGGPPNMCSLLNCDRQILWGMVTIFVAAREYCSCFWFPVKDKTSKKVMNSLYLCPCAQDLQDNLIILEDFCLHLR